MRLLDGRHGIYPGRSGTGSSIGCRRSNEELIVSFSSSPVFKNPVAAVLWAGWMSPRLREALLVELIHAVHSNRSLIFSAC
jgi:hypothetical protein